LNGDEISLEKRFLPYSRQVIDEEDIKAVTDVLRGDWLTTGPTIEKFEFAFANKLGARCAIACSSGTAGLHLLAISAGIGPGDSVIVPTITFLATANAVRYTGAEVVFSDVNANTGMMEASHYKEALRRASNKNIKAVFPVHLNGQCVDTNSLDFDEGGDVLVFEDACHALGASVFDLNGQANMIGSCHSSKAAVFSTHAVKAIATGEGGVITTNDEELALRLKRLRNHGIVRGKELFANKIKSLNEDNSQMKPWYYEMQELGFNYRSSDIHCALGLSQLEKLTHFISKRALLKQGYEVQLRRLGEHVQSIPVEKQCIPAWHLAVVLIDFEALDISRSEVMNKLYLKGIGTQVHYIPVHEQPYYKSRSAALSLPGASDYYSRCLSLPLWPGMELDDVDRVIESLAEALNLVIEY
jgi:UDP-4-amino-4,6-dideoxy-N-acetyl-beta-L-altrosamine transaminase